VNLGNGDEIERGGEPRLALAGDHDRSGFVSAIDRNFFGDIVGRRSDQARGTHEDHRFRREIDVLLVFGRVVGDRLVAKL
jgi:hypothetical protein